MKQGSIVLALGFVSLLSLTGCGATSQSQPTPTNTVQNQTQQSTMEQSTDIATGVSRMLTLAASLKSSISSGDTEQVQQTAPQLETTWSSFEDSVKAAYPDVYAEVEQYLDPTVAGSKITPMNVSALAKLNDQLIQALNQLNEKVKANP